MGINRSCPFLFWTLGCRRLTEVHAILLTKILLLAERGCRREAAKLCAGHAQQLGGESPPANLMEVKA